MRKNGAFAQLRRFRLHVEGATDVLDDVTDGFQRPADLAAGLMAGSVVDGGDGHTDCGAYDHPDTHASCKVAVVVHTVTSPCALRVMCVLLNRRFTAGRGLKALEKIIRLRKSAKPAAERRK